MNLVEGIEKIVEDASQLVCEGKQPSIPVAIKMGENISLGMFFYSIMERNSQLFVTRPTKWGAWSKELELQAINNCSFFDFASDLGIAIESVWGVNDIEPQDSYIEKYTEILECFSIIFDVVLKDVPLTEVQLSAKQRYCDLFNEIVETPLIPFYTVFAPEFFCWLGIGENSIVQQSSKHNMPQELENLSGAIRQLEEKMDELQRSFDTKIRTDKTKDTQFDNMHREIQEYKNGLIEKGVLSMSKDIILLIDDINKSLKMIDTHPEEERFSRMRRVVDNILVDLNDLLYRQDIEPYNVPGNATDALKQKIVSLESTDNPELDKTVASRLADGYEKNGRVIRPERITAYVYNLKN